MTLTLTLAPDEAVTYLAGDDIAGLDLRKTYDAHAVDLLALADVGSVTVVHPDGFVAWHYDSSDLRANGGTL